MTSANAVETSAVCAFPGCTRPVRQRAGDGGGKPPVYCDLTNEKSGKFVHTALTKAREEARLARTSATGLPAGDTGETPASAARERATTLLEQFRSTATGMAAQLAEAIAAFEAAGDPDTVSAELKAARRSVDKTRLETEERITAAELARDQAEATAAQLAEQARQAIEARDEAIAELETAETTAVELREEQAAERQRAADEVAALRTEHAALRTEHAAELEQVRTTAAEQVQAAQATAEQQVAAAREQARGEIETARVRFAEQLATAETERDRAQDTATRAEQAAADAIGQRDELRTDLKALRTDHRDELVALRREHREELVAERQRADATAEAVRAEHAREIEGLNRVLEALRNSLDQAVAAPVAETSDTSAAAAQTTRRAKKD